MNPTPNRSYVLPHEQLEVYALAKQLLLAVRNANIRDAKLRDEALRSAKGSCLNIAEGASRLTRADKGRAYTVARGEAGECAAALEIAHLIDAVSEKDERIVHHLASRIVVMLSRLSR